MESRFIADAMLGKLARWLRMMGNDTLYDAALDDAELVRAARAQDRILITRDVDLAKRTGVRIILLQDDALEEQLEQLMKLLPICNPGQPRCPVCNTPLRTISKKDAWGNVPLYAFTQNEHFQWCRGCGAYYWPGSQWRRIRSFIDHLEIDTRRCS